MIKQMAWNTFKKTGSIDAFLEFKQIESLENLNNQSLNLDTNEKNINYLKDET